MAEPVNVDDLGASLPRLLGLRIATDGAVFDNPLHATVRHNRWFHANTFEVKINLWGSHTYTLDWWGSNDRVDNFPIEIEFGVGNPDDGYAGLTWNQMLVGQVDKLLVDTAKGTVTLHGRDNSAALLDTYTFEAFPNRKIIDIITALCERAGVGADVGGGGTNKAASEFYRNGDYNITSGLFNHLVSYWDLICYLAKRAGCFVYMDNNSVLHVHPDDNDPDIWEVVLTPPDITPPVTKLNPSNTTKITLERDLNLARNTSVIVTSYDAQKKELYYGIDADSKARGGIKGRQIQHVKPGIGSNAEAVEAANAIKLQTIKHEKKVHWSQPGDLELSVLAKARITTDGGTTQWHQDYFIESIDRTMDWKTGFTMKCVGTNSDPELSTVLQI